jgi:hypothetical protein
MDNEMENDQDREKGSLIRRALGGFDRIAHPGESEKLGDFIMTVRVIPISLIAIGVGVLSSFVALVLLRLIGLFTNLFFYQRLDTSLVSPAGNSLGIFEVLVPVAGAVIIGFMVRYGLLGTAAEFTTLSPSSCARLGNSKNAKINVRTAARRRAKAGVVLAAS